MGFTVYGNSVPYLILNNKHTYLFKLFSKLLNIVTHNSAFDIYICPVVEYIK